MKKTISILMAAAVMGSMLCACSAKGAPAKAAKTEVSPAVAVGDVTSQVILPVMPVAAVEAETEGTDLSSLKTLGDIFTLDECNYINTWDEKTYIQFFMIGKTPYRVTADMPKAIYEKLSSMMEKDYEETDGFDKELKATVSGLKIKTFEDLSGYVMDQATIDSLKGKNGQALLDKGFTIDDCNFYEGEAYVQVWNDMFSYKVKVNGDETLIKDDEAREQFFKTATIKDIELLDFGFNPRAIGKGKAV